MTTQTARFVINGQRFGVTMTTEKVSADKVAQFRTINHEPIPADAVKLSLAGDCQGGGGQIVDTLRKAGEGVPDIVRLCDIWDRWHLNDTTAGSAKQVEFLRANPIKPEDYKHPKTHYDVACERLAAAGLNPDASGYKYGSAWLFDLIPAEIVAEAKAVMDRLNGGRFGTSDGTDDPLDLLSPTKRVEAIAERAGVTMSALFVPWSQSRNKGEKHHSLNWHITLLRGKAPILTTDYTAGTGSCPADKLKYEGARGTAAYDKRQLIEWECENGVPGYYKFSRHISRRNAKSIMPQLADVLQSLLSDSSVLDYRSFEHWAADYGDSPDSRKAEATYRACLDIALKLRNGLGEKLMAELQEACQEL